MVTVNMDLDHFSRVLTEKGFDISVRVDKSDSSTGSIYVFIADDCKTEEVQADEKATQEQEAFMQNVQTTQNGMGE